ncbi:hypothetical protein PBCV1_a251aL [Paramecium bursaria Chlorella virus 1]|uniref:Uncharacterized protein n=1 Tax=Paramecium bursaria Chlorella virus 1 TaxID=10506 RepID=A0AA97PYG1_PBCV1|nr:hypothetical protein PBCV1_a251aL [Paramecium bursaria Chlorella virus 1]AAC96619.2 hypothetical protein [Paramecium bursaria Chlorella virus 1]
MSVLIPNSVASSLNVSNVTVVERVCRGAKTMRFKAVFLNFFKYAPYTTLVFLTESALVNNDARRKLYSSVETRSFIRSIFSRMISILIALSSVKYILFPLGEYVSVTNPGMTISFVSRSSRVSIIFCNLSENGHFNPFIIT